MICSSLGMQENPLKRGLDFQNILCWIFIENQNIQNILCGIFWKSKYSKNLGYSKYSTGLLWIFWFSTNIQQQYILNICHIPLWCISEHLAKADMIIKMWKVNLFEVFKVYPLHYFKAKYFFIKHFRNLILGPNLLKMAFTWTALICLSFYSVKMRKLGIS